MSSAPDPTPKRVEGSPWLIERHGERRVLPPGLVIATHVRGGALLDRETVPALPDGAEVFISLEARYSDDLRRYEVHQVRVDASGPPSTDVTSALLRALPMQRLLRDVVVYSVEPADDPVYGLEVVAEFAPPGVEQTSRFRRQLESERARRKPSDPATMRDVAAVYRMAEITSEAPVRAVERAFALERHSALYWIRKARQGGWLEARG